MSFFSIQILIKLKKKELLKRLKKKNYIYIKNKNSYWKNIKKNLPKELDYKLYGHTVIPNYCEFDSGLSTIFILKELTSVNIFDHIFLRHNLDKLNTYKLNI